MRNSPFNAQFSFLVDTGQPVTPEEEKRLDEKLVVADWFDGHKDSHTGFKKVCVGFSFSPESTDSHFVFATVSVDLTEVEHRKASYESILVFARDKAERLVKECLAR